MNMARIVTIIAEDPEETLDGRTRLRATVEIDIVVSREIESLKRIPEALASLPASLLNLWHLDDLEDAIDFHREPW